MRNQLGDARPRKVRNLIGRILTAKGVATMSSGKDSAGRACGDGLDERKRKIGAHVRRVLQKMIDRRQDNRLDELGRSQTKSNEFQGV